jgi:hypothetical protein
MPHNEHVIDHLNKDKNLLYPNKSAYLRLVEDWQDPNPKPIIEEHDGIQVVREDYLKYGSKMRFIDYTIKNLTADEIVYAQPRQGYAGISLCAVAKRYHKRVSLFIPLAKELSEHQERCRDLGAELHAKKIYGMSGLRKYARDHAIMYNAHYIEMGFKNDPYVTASIVKVASEIPEPKEVWTVLSTGVLHRALQIAWPNAVFHGVAVARNMKRGEVGHGNVYSHPYPFLKAEKDEELPPFASAKAYDAKAWRYIKQHASKGALFWNVAGD